MKISEYFGEDAFTNAQLKTRVNKKTFEAFKVWQDGGNQITSDQADEIAKGMMDWAIERGASSYTHWFQPMTGATAEKHDSFIDFNHDQTVLENFKGSQLIQGEPDASSFPSGGLRATFEARGYTIWDPSSPAFIINKTLCIPCVFISYNGEALDKKLPLIRSDIALDVSVKRALGIIRQNGNIPKRVFSTCGPEQEYFLIDKKYVDKRPDLLLANKTMLGAPSPKDQQLDDQYFGSIAQDAIDYMSDVAKKAHRLGIPLKTRHNEVAPRQYEFAPIFEKSTVAVDHNQLLMDIMKRTAKEHGKVCILHEKPFQGINGGGKHLNWSISDNEGNNMLKPGDTPEKNIRFLTVLTAVIKAVYEHSDLLRASIASVGNEHRLGANEAPPAIMSIFLGDTLQKVVDNIIKGVDEPITMDDIIDTGIGRLPNLAKDNTDRNRTSPFAFTGDKFEFRAVGSSSNISSPLTVINTAVADALGKICDDISKSLKDNVEPPKSLNGAILEVLAKHLDNSKEVLFNGDNYSDEWVKEAESRGLSNIPSTPEALSHYVSDSSVKLFEDNKVLNKAELDSRYNVKLDIYIKSIEIECKAMIQMVNTQALPAGYLYLDMLSRIFPMDSNGYGLGDNPATEMAKLLANINNRVESLQNLLDGVYDTDVDKAIDMYSTWKIRVTKLRYSVDILESKVSDKLWDIPKYHEMLFI